MQAEATLAHAFAARHPVEFARELERHSPSEAAHLLVQLPAQTSTAVLKHMQPLETASCVAAMPSEAAAAIIATLPAEIGSGLLRRLDAPIRNTVIAAMPDDAARAARQLLEHPADSAGAIMDPTVLTLPPDITVSEALHRVNADPAHVLYYVYITSEDHRLQGVVTIRELMLADGDAFVRDLMTPRPVSVSTRQGAEAIASHAGWTRYFALPVVDRHGVFLGVVRYEALRQIEAALSSAPESSGDLLAARALGELYALGVSAVLEWGVASARGPRRERSAP